MNKIWVIAKREFSAAILSKAFLITLLTMPLAIAAGAVLPLMIGRFKSKEVRKVVLLDRTPGSGIGAVAVLEMLRDRPGETRAGQPVASDGKADANGKDLAGDVARKEASDDAGGGLLASGGAATRKALERIEFETIRGPADPAEALRLQYELGERVTKGEIAAFFDIAPEALELGTSSSGSPKTSRPKGDAATGGEGEAADEGEEGDEADEGEGTITYFTDRALDSDVLMGVGGNLVAIVQMQRTASRNPLLLLRKERRYTPHEIADILSAAEQDSKSVLVRRDFPKRDASGVLVPGKRVGATTRAILPAALAAILFFSVLVVASPQLQGVIEEKTNRIGEVLLGSATPFQVLSGKLLGLTATGLVLSLVYAIGMLFFAWRWGIGEGIGWGIPVWFVTFEVLALLLFGALFVAVGSACNDMKEAQNLLMPVTIMMSLPMICLPEVLEDPTGSFARWVSLFPFGTPPLMLCRLAAAPNLPIWEPLLGVALVLLTTLGVVWVASRIFRIGYLSTGKAPTVLELIRWVASRS
jgi:ABC-type Na+ efflux pump permease subunit